MSATSAGEEKRGILRERAGLRRVRGAPLCFALAAVSGYLEHTRPIRAKPHGAREAAHRVARGQVVASEELLAIGEPDDVDRRGSRCAQFSRLRFGRDATAVLLLQLVIEAVVGVVALHVSRRLPYFLVGLLVLLR